MEIHIALGSAPAKSIQEAALIPEVRTTLQRWLRVQPKAQQGVLIGGLALAFYSRPRQTTDVDLMFKATTTPNLESAFKYIRKHAAIDKDTHVELEFVTASSVNLPQAVVDRVVDTAHNIGGLRIASLDAMIVLKLYGSDTPRRRLQDSADIQSMLEHNPSLDVQALMESWRLGASHQERLLELHAIARS